MKSLMHLNDITGIITGIDTSDEVIQVLDGKRPELTPKETDNTTDSPVAPMWQLQLIAIQRESTEEFVLQLRRRMNKLTGRKGKDPPKKSSPSKSRQMKAA